LVQLRRDPESEEEVMAIDVDELHEFYERAREVLGREWATTH